MDYHKLTEALRSSLDQIKKYYNTVVTVFREKPVAKSMAVIFVFLLMSMGTIAYLYTRPIPDADIYVSERRPYPGFSARMHHLVDILTGRRFLKAREKPKETLVELKDESSETELTSVTTVYQNILPQPLSPVSVQRYSDAFQALRDKKMAEVLNEMQLVQDKLLKPDIDLALKHASVRKPVKEEVTSSLTTDKFNEAFGTRLKHYSEVRALERRLLYSTNTLKQAGFQYASSVINQAKNLNSDEHAYLFAQLALHALQFGDDAIADAYARASGTITQNRWGYPIFIQGLLAWRENEFKKAQTFFNIAANAPIATKSTRVASAFWAARSSTTDRLAYEGWLKRAAQYNDDFYGILAEGLLEDMHGSAVHSAKGRDNHDLASLRMDIELVRHLPKGERLFGLLQIHEDALAQSLLDSMLISERKNTLAISAIQHVGRYAGLEVKGEDSDASTPVSTSREFLKTFVPQGGFKLNPALIYGVVHTESHFNSRVISPAGAIGLMQIQPETARFIMRPESVLREQLFQPSYNLLVGQRYLLELPNLVGAKDLFHVLAAYNAGPAAVSSWERKQLAVSDKVKEDPFYFLETLPNIETRSYVRHVVAQSWLYAKALHLASPSKKALINKQWPLLKDERSGFTH